MDRVLDTAADLAPLKDILQGNSEVAIEMLCQKTREVVYMKTALELVTELSPNNPEVLEVVRYTTQMAILETVEDRPSQAWNFR